MTARMVSILQLTIESGVLFIAFAIALAKGRRLFSVALGPITAQPLVTLLFSTLAWAGHVSGYALSIAISLSYWVRIVGFAALLCSVAALGKDQMLYKPSEALRRQREVVQKPN